MSECVVLNQKKLFCEFFISDKSLVQFDECVFAEWSPTAQGFMTKPSDCDCCQWQSH